MRSRITLTSWNEEREFGFIEPQAITAINDKDNKVGLRVTPLQYTIQRGEQVAAITANGHGA